MALLEVHDIHTYYGNIHALKGISISVEQGEIVTLIGSNGAGKSTTLKTICGLTPARSGKVILEGEDITETPAHDIVSKGVTQAPEGRRIFGRLTVYENLVIGAYTRQKSEINQSLEEVFTIFPRRSEERRVGKEC